MRKTLIFLSVFPILSLLALVLPLSHPLAPASLPDPTLIPIRWSASGSMHPTLPKGVEGQIMGYAYPKKQITLIRGDIVTFTTTATSSGLIKRIIAIPGDTLELRDGLVYLNNIPQKEAYVDSAYSTYGHTFLNDCSKITIPENRYFVMGDNRKISFDSREIGLVDQEDITATIPYFLQLHQLDSGWHNPDLDTASSAKPKIDKSQYTTLLNQIRESKSLPKLTYSDSTAWQPVTGQIEHNGYYTAQELFDYEDESPNFAKLVSNKDYQFVHISETDALVSSCPSHKITVTLSGYVPPNYDAKFISGWSQTLSVLRDIAPSWSQLNKTADGKRINEIINIRIKNLTPIIAKLQKQQWLTPDESKYLETDIKLSSEEATLAAKLNSE